MESSVLHEKYQKAFGPIAYEDLMRYVYLDGRLFGKYETGECLIDNTVTSFVSFGGLDAKPDSGTDESVRTGTGICRF